MIEFIRNDAKGTVIYQTDHTIRQNGSALRYVKLLCEFALFSLDGYLVACRKHQKTSYRTPVVIDDETQLIPSGGLRNYETVWINYPAIRGLENHGTGIRITFVSGSILELDLTPYVWKRQIDELTRIRNTKVKHFHG